MRTRIMVVVLSSLFLATFLASFPASVAAQSKPNFAGKWMEIGGESTLLVTQDARAITVEINGLRWVTKLDGSESRNVTLQGNREIEQTSTAAWDGDKLAISTPGRSTADGPFVVKQVWSIEAGNLVISSTQTAQPSGTILFETRTTYRKAA